MRHSTTLVVGGFSWNIRIAGNVAIIDKPTEFPTHLPVSWEDNETIQMFLREPTPRPVFGFAIQAWYKRVISEAEGLVRGFIRREILVHWKREVAKKKRQESRSKAPQRSRKHRNFRALR